MDGLKYKRSSMKRYGDTEDTIKRFYMMADRCNPPLPDEELKTILRSASKYYEKIRKEEGYITPEVYNAQGPVKWEEPIPFGRYTVSRFPIDALPEDVAAYVSAVAKSTQTPVDMAGTVAIALL